MEDKIPFSVVRGLENKIESLKYQDGRVYFATDTKKIYLDAAGKRTPMGGNTGIFYANSE